MDQEDSDWKALLEGVRQNDETACLQFWNEYSPLIEQFAQRNIGRQLQRRVGPESIMISACRTFFRRAQQGEFELSDSNALWSLLCAITINKVRQQGRYHSRQKRRLSDEAQLTPSSSDSEDRHFEFVASDASPAMLAEFEDQFQHLVAHLTEEEAHILQLKLDNETNQQIAHALECTERTVRRKLKSIQEHLRSAFDSE